MNSVTDECEFQLLQNLFAACVQTRQAVALFNAEDQLVFANKAYRDAFIGGREGSYSFAEVLRYGDRERTGTYIDDSDVEALIDRTYRRRRSTPFRSFETDLLDGRWFWMDETTLPNRWVLTVGTDITALKHNERTLRQAHEHAVQLANTDQLTGLSNRRCIFEKLDGILAKPNDSLPTTIALIDLDHFKAINDNFGHEAGDAVLRHFSDTWKGFFGPNVVMGRIGGEEFLLILSQMDSGRAERYLGEVRKAFSGVDIGGCSDPVRYTFSAGVCQVQAGDTMISLMRRADQSMYAAKRAGRNCSRSH